MSSFTDVTRREWHILWPLAALTIFYGIYPEPILDTMRESVAELISHVELNS
jgi:NADH:ubiquinone oxidoreductase subunit 4 (subunit M)